MPAGIKVSECCQFETHVSESADESNLATIANAFVEPFEIDDSVEPSFVLLEVDWWFVVLCQLFGTVDEAGQVLLEVCGDEADDESCVRMYVPL